MSKAANLAGFATAVSPPSDLSIGILTATSAIIGTATTFTEDLVVQGDARVTGILTVGTSSITLDGSNNEIKIGAGITISSTGITGTPSIVVGFTTVGTALSLTGYYVENITAVAALDIDCSTANYFTKTIDGDSIFTFSNVPSGGAYSFTLELTHTSGTVTWPTEVKWPADTAPTLTTGKTHLFIFVTDDGGTRWRGSSLVDYTN